MIIYNKLIFRVRRYQGEMILLRVILCSVLFSVVLSGPDRLEYFDHQISIAAADTEERRLSQPGRPVGGGGGVLRGKAVKQRRKKNSKPGKKRTRKFRGRKGKGKGRRREKKRTNAGNEKKRRRKNNGVNSRTTSTIGLNETCFTQAIFFMKLWKDTVANYKKQKSRMSKQNSTGSGKSGKKGLFAPVALRLVDIGGGNKTNMSCGGEYGNKGAIQLQNLTKTLFDCEIEVNKSW